MRKGFRFVIATAAVAVLAVGLLPGGASAGTGQTRSQSGKTSNDACVTTWGSSVASYRVDWTSYYDANTFTTYYGYVANISNTAGGVLAGVSVYGTPADLVGGGNTDAHQPVATVSLDTNSLAGVPIGAIGFYGKAQVTSTDGGAGYGLPTYSGSSGKALGSYTICYSSVGSLG